MNRVRFLLVSTMTVAALPGQLFGVGAADVSVAYKVAAYFGVQDYYDYHAVGWGYGAFGAASDIKSQEYLLVSVSGDIAYFEFVPVDENVIGDVLAPALFSVAASYKLEVRPEKVAGLCSALRALTVGDEIGMKPAGPLDLIIVSSAGNRSVGYRKDELSTTALKIEELRNALRRGADAEEIGNLCSRHWGETSWHRPAGGAEDAGS